MTHAELVGIAVRWLKKTRRCSVVLAEPSAIHGQSPDAIGWASYFSTMVECKVSRADFRADQKKHGRQRGYRMARRCYYLTPPGLIRIDELPPLWGLLEVHGTTVRMVHQVPLEDFADPRSVEELRLELSFLWAELRRYHAQGITYNTIGRVLRGRRGPGHPAQAHVLDLDPADEEVLEARRLMRLDGYTGARA